MLTRPVIPFALAGLLWTCAQAVEPDAGATDAARYAHISAHPGLENAAALLFVLAGAALVLAGLAGVRSRPTGRGGRSASVGSSLLAVAGLWLAAGRGMSDVIGWAVSDPRVPARSAALLIGTSGGPAFTVLVLALVALLAAPVVLAVGTRRAGRSSWLPLVLWVVGILAFTATEFSVKPVQVAGIAVAGAALVLLGRALTPTAAGIPVDAVARPTGVTG